MSKKIAFRCFTTLSSTKECLGPMKIYTCSFENMSFPPVGGNKTRKAKLMQQFCPPHWKRQPGTGPAATAGKQEGNHIFKHPWARGFCPGVKLVPLHSPPGSSSALQHLTWSGNVNPQVWDQTPSSSPGNAAVLLEQKHVNNACPRIIYIPNTPSWYPRVNHDARCNISRFFSQQINTPSHQQICVINWHKCKRTDIFLWVLQQSNLCYRLLSAEKWLRDP